MRSGQTPQRRRSRRKPRPRRASTWCVAYLVVLLVAWEAEAFVAEHWWLTTLLTYLPQWPLAVPLPFLLLYALARRDARALIACAAAALVLAFPLNNLCLPLTRVSGPPALRLMTFNIHGSRSGVERVAAAVRRAAPDVVCLQEAKAEEGFPDPFPALRARLSGYAFTRAEGVVVASRLPIRSAATRSFTDRRIWRKALDVRVDAGGRTVRIIAVHFITLRGGLRRGVPATWHNSGATRIAQANDVTFWLNETDLPTAVAGDFNTPPRGLAFARLRNAAHSAFEDAGLGFGCTYPASHPMLRIDHVFTANGLRATSARVGPPGASDHRPLICDLALTPEK